MDSHLLRYDKEKTIVFIDLETFNLCLNFCHNRPWQLGMLLVKGDDALQSKDILVKWDTHLKISEDAARITRYDQSKVDRIGVTQEEAFLAMENWLEKADYIIGHNVLGFDIYLILEWYKLNGKSGLHLIDKFIDTNLIAKGLKTQHNYSPGDNFLAYQYKLNNLYAKGVKTRLQVLGQEYNIPHDYDNLHDALIDLSLNLKVWNKLKWAIEI